jgi:Tol biopolymer transport system component
VKRPGRAGIITAVALLAVACTSNGAAPHDPGKVVLPGKHVTVPGKLYATKGRSLYRFSGTHLTPLLAGVKVKDPGISADGARLAVAQMEEQSSTIVLSDAEGKARQTITPPSGPEGALWAFAPHYSDDAQRIVYLTDRGKQSSSPQNLQPNDLGVWSYDLGSGKTRRLVAPIPYTGGDSDPVFRPGANDQLLYTTYLYGGAPLQTVARLTWMSTATMATVYLSPDVARNFQPTFSPDGRFVAYIHADAGSDELYVMPLEPTFSRESRPYPTDRALLLQSGIVAQPVWAPDGRAIAFLKLVNGSFDLFILPVSTDGTIHATGQAEGVTHGSFLDADSRLAWSP